MNNRPLISVVTICFNAEKTIEDTIKSVLSQDYDDYEYLIIDGGSGDRTLEMVRKYADTNPKIKVSSEPDKGISDAFNKGIRKSAGVLVGLLNSDDQYLPNALKSIAETYEKSGADIVYGDTVVEDTDNNLTIYKKASPISQLAYEMPFIHQSCFISKAAYEKYGMYKEQYKICMDYDCLCSMKEATFAYTGTPISCFSYGGTSCKYPIKTINENVSIAIKHGLPKTKAVRYYLKTVSRNAIKIVLQKVGLWNLLYRLIKRKKLVE